MLDFEPIFDTNLIMKKIVLTRNKFSIVDDEDYEFLNQWKWHCTSFGYAVRWDRTVTPAKIIRMHRIIINAPADKQVDHIDFNKLNNCKSNLRFCSSAQNSQSHKKQIMYGNKPTSSKYKGVSWLPTRSHWKVNIQVNKVKIYVGSSRNEIEAAKMYNEAAKKYFGEFGVFNVIE